MAGAELHAGVDCLGRQAGLLLQRDRGEEIGEEQAVNDEARDVGHDHRGLAEPLAERDRPRARLRAGLLREGELDELHLRHRVEDVQTDEALGRPAGAGELRDRERRGRRPEQRFIVGDLCELTPQRGLGVEVLDDGLDDRGRVAQRAQVLDDLDVLGVDLAAEPSAVLVHRAACSLRRVVRARPEDHLTVAGGSSRQPTGDRSTADDPEALVHRAGVLSAVLGRPLPARGPTPSGSPSRSPRPAAGSSAGRRVGRRRCSHRERRRSGRPDGRSRRGTGSDRGPRRARTGHRRTW